MARFKENTKLTATDILTLQDIQRQGGYVISDKNFKTEQQRMSFYKKFPELEEIKKQLEFADRCLEIFPRPQEQTKFMMLKSSAASKALDLLREPLTQGLRQSGQYYLCEGATRDLVSQRRGTFAIIADFDSKIADVILPSNARSGGIVRVSGFPDKTYFVSPDEVMSPTARKLRSAEVVVNDNEMWDKDKISTILLKNGMEYVRFHDRDLPLRVPDNFFYTKTVFECKTEGGEIAIIQKWDGGESWQRSDAADKKVQRIPKVDYYDKIDEAYVKQGKNGEGHLHIRLSDGSTLPPRTLKPKQLTAYIESQDRHRYLMYLVGQIYPDVVGSGMKTTESEIYNLKQKVDNKTSDRILEGATRKDMHIDGLYLFREENQYIAHGYDAKKMHDLNGLTIYGKKDPKVYFAASKLEKMLPKLVQAFDGVAIIGDGKKPKLYGVDFTTSEYKISHFEKNWKLLADQNGWIKGSFPNGSEFYAKRYGRCHAGLDLGIIDNNNNFISIMPTIAVLDWKKSIDQNIAEAMDKVIEANPHLAMHEVNDKSDIRKSFSR